MSEGIQVKINQARHHGRGAPGQEPRELWLWGKEAAPGGAAKGWRHGFWEERGFHSLHQGEDSGENLRMTQERGDRAHDNDGLHDTGGGPQGKWQEV